MNGAQPSGYARILLRVLAIGGYGLWIRLGMALGMERSGRMRHADAADPRQRVYETALAGALPANG